MQPHELPPRSGFGVSPYEQVASWVVALLMLVGLSVSTMFVLWYTSQGYIPPRVVPVELVESAGGGDNSINQGGGGAFEAPNLDDLTKQPELQLNSLPQLVAAIPAALARRKVASNQQSVLGDPGASGAGGGGGGAGSGPGQGEGRAGFTRAERWEIRWPEGTSLTEYARCLDYFKIELGLVGAANEVIYVRQFRAAQPAKRTARREQEQRLFLSWRRGKLQQADRDLLNKAGADPGERVILQFIPPDLEETLAQLEHRYANRQPYEIRRTLFAVRSRGTGFEFVVLEQQPLVAR